MHIFGGEGGGGLRCMEDKSDHLSSSIPLWPSTSYQTISLASSIAPKSTVKQAFQLL
jgi:hypothetical protein